MDKCGICLKPAVQLFETGKEGVYACFKCQPLVPEVTIGDSADQGQVPSSHIIEIEVESAKTEDDDLDEIVEGLFCGICNKTFQKNGQLQAHLRNHRAERRFVCTYCNKAFSQSNNLRAHLRIHTNERPYKCSECGKAFTQVTNLNNHVRLHTGERPFICPEPGCNKAYAQVTNLNQHRKRHLNGRPLESSYDCPVCGERFAQRNHMYNHRRAAHSEGCPPPRRPRQTHACALCDAVLPSEKQLRAHVASHADPAHSPDGDGDQGTSHQTEYACVFRSCGARFVSPHEHTEHLLRAHQLRVLASTSASAPGSAPPASARAAPVPQAKRGRPPKRSESFSSEGYEPHDPPSFDFVSVDKIKSQPLSIDMKTKNFRPIKIINATKFLPNIKLEGMQ